MIRSELVDVAGFGANVRLAAVQTLTVLALSTPWWGWGRGGGDPAQAGSTLRLDKSARSFSQIQKTSKELFNF